MKNFTSTKDVPDLGELIALSQSVKKDPFHFKVKGENKTLGLLFFNPSLRTRLSTQKAAHNLGMRIMMMNFNEEGWKIELEDGAIMSQGSQEHIKEAAGVISQYCDIIGIRTFAGLKNRADDYSEHILSKFIQYASAPIISLESATLHPLQSLADLLTIKELGIPNPKVVLTWAPHPKALPQAVSNSFSEWITAMNYDLTITHPKGFELDQRFTKNAKITHNQNEAFANADIVYAKNWSSYNDYGKVGATFSDWTITPEKMILTNDAHFMHCLPVRRNVVVTDAVLDSSKSLVLKQADNRTWAAQAVLLKLLGYEN